MMEYEEAGGEEGVRMCTYPLQGHKWLIDKSSTMAA